MVLAQQESQALKHDYIGTEHLLLGLLREEDGLAARVIESFDISAKRVRDQVIRIVGTGPAAKTGQIPFTPRAKKVLELALREAQDLGHNYIGTEHILLGLAREDEGVAMRILLDFDADADKVRNEVMHMLSGPGGRRTVRGVQQPETTAASGPAPFLARLGQLIQHAGTEAAGAGRSPDDGDLLLALSPARARSWSQPWASSAPTRSPPKPPSAAPASSSTSRRVDRFAGRSSPLWRGRSTSEARAGRDRVGARRRNPLNPIGVSL